MCLGLGENLLLTTTEAMADCSPWEFMAETRYCAVSSKSHLKGKNAAMTWTIRHWEFSRGRRPSPTSTSVLSDTQIIPTMWARDCEAPHNSWPKINWQQIDTISDVIRARWRRSLLMYLFRAVHDRNQQSTVNVFHCKANVFILMSYGCLFKGKNKDQ